MVPGVVERLLKAAALVVIAARRVHAVGVSPRGRCRYQQHYQSHNGHGRRRTSPHVGIIWERDGRRELETPHGERPFLSAQPAK